MILRLVQSILAIAFIGGIAAIALSDHLGMLGNRDILRALLFAQPVLVLAQFVIGLRLVRSVGPDRLSFRPALGASLFAQACDLFLPMRLSEFVRVAYLNRRANIPAADGLAAMVLERVSDLVVLAMLAAFAAALTAVGANIWTIAGIAVAAVAFLLLFPHLHGILETIAGWLPVARLRNLAQDALRALRDRLESRAFWMVLLPTIVAWLMSLAATAIYLIALQLPDLQVTLPLVLLIFLATTIGAAAAVLPAGIGTYEAAVVLVLTAKGINWDTALAVAVGLHATHLLTGLIGGAIVFSFDPGLARSVLGRARRLRQDEEPNGPAGAA